MNGSAEQEMGDFGSTKRLTSTSQDITLLGEDTANSFTVYGQDVTIRSSIKSSTNESSGSNKVKTSPVVNFDWEQKYNHGDLVSVHRAGIHVAYSIKGHSGGVIRVINRKTAARDLIKGFCGRVCDVKFAYSERVLLGAVDEMGGVALHEIKDLPSGQIESVRLLHINRPSETTASEFHRLIWCPYIPDDSDVSGNTIGTESSVDDFSKLMVVTMEEKAEIWNVDVILRDKEDSNRSLVVDDIDLGLLYINEHSAPINAAAFSPDGTALATASEDGLVKFFQVYFEGNENPRRLHEWKPHSGLPVNSLFFLDDYRHSNANDRFWRFAITCAKYNSEIKFWSCEDWLCLQTINFAPSPDPPANFSIEPCLKASVDLSSRHLIMTDVKRKVLYVVTIHQTHQRAHASSISEFLLALPCVSFAVVDAGKCNLKKTFDLDDQQVGTFVKLYSVHTRVLQELQIRFFPATMVSSSQISETSISSDIADFNDRLSDVSAELVSPIDKVTRENTSSREEEATVSVTPGSSFTEVTGLDDGTPKAATQRVTSSNMAAAGQSPVSSVTLTPASSRDVPPLALSSSTQEGEHDEEEENEDVSVDDDEPENGVVGAQEENGGAAPYIDDMFDTQGALRRKLQSTGSSSSTSLEVVEIMEGVRQQRSAISDTEQHLNIPSEVVEKAWLQHIDHSSSIEHEENHVVPNEEAVYDFDQPQDDDVRVEEEEPEPEEKVDGKLKTFVIDSEEGPRRSTNEPAAELNLNVSNDLTEMKHQMNQMMEMIRTQQTQMTQLCAQLERQRVNHTSFQNLQTQMSHLEKNVTLRVVGALNQHSLAEHQRLQAIMVEREGRDEQRLQRLQAKMVEAVEFAMKQKVYHVIKEEIVSCFNRYMEPFKQQLNQELSTKLTSADTVIKDNVAKLVRSRQTMEQIGQSVSAGLQAPLQSILRDMIVPGIDRSCQHLYQQLNETFSRGTKEYTNGVEQHMEQLKRRLDESNEIALRKLSTVVTSSADGSSRLNNVATELEKVKEEIVNENDNLKKMHSDFNTILREQIARSEMNMLTELRRMFRDELTSAMRDQQTSLNDNLIQAMRSGAVTPISVPDPDVQRQNILGLLRQGQLNQAFQTALSAADLNLVMFVCEKVNPSQIFNQSPCPLQQPVLLSLVQQLCAELHHNTDLKHKYLEEAVMNLDSSNPVTKEHMSSVLGALCQRLVVYIQNHPQDKMTRQMKMLHMASQSLLK